MKNTTKRTTKKVNGVEGTSVLYAVPVTESPEIILARSTMSNSYDLCGKKIASVAESLLDLDGEYQRVLSSSTVHTLVKEWNINDCDPLLVSYRDNKFYVIDGQHRLIAGRYVGVKEFPCVIRTGLTRQDEALIFARQNRNKRKLGVYDTFKANICNGDASIKEVFIDMEMKRICEERKISINRTNRWNRNDRILRSPAEARIIIECNGSKCFEWIINTICASENWNNCPESTAKNKLVMLKSFYVEHENDIEKYTSRILRVMEDFSPMEIEGEAKKNYSKYGLQTGLNICFKKLVGNV